MSKKYYFPRNSTRYQDNMISHKHENQNNQTETEEIKSDQSAKKEESLDEEMKAKCTVSNKKVEQGTAATYYNSNITMDKKLSEAHVQYHDSYYPAVPYQESPQQYGRMNFPPVEQNGRWDNCQKQYEQKEVPAYVYNVHPNFHGELAMNYPARANTPNNQMFKAYTPAQYDFSPNSNGGAFTKVYHWHSNVPNTFRPGGPPVPLFKNVDIHAQHSVADDFSDLPLDNKETLRFFYNLGIEYFRLGSFIFPTTAPVSAIENSNTLDYGNNQEKYLKKRDYCRKSHLSQKNYRTL